MAKAVKNDLVLQIEQCQLGPEAGKSLKERFLPFFEQAEAWKAKAETLVVTDASQTDEMRLARESRLALKDIRVNVEKARVELKEDSLREGKAIDGIARVIKSLIEPIEEHLTKQERFVVIQEAARKTALSASRSALLRPFEVNAEFYDLANMPEEGFQQLLDSSKIAFEQKKEVERQAEEDRIAEVQSEIEERERLRIENERLQKDAEARGKKIAEEITARKKIEDELRFRDAKEAARKAIIDAENKAQEDADKKALLAPEKEKLTKWVEELEMQSILLTKADSIRVAREIESKLMSFKRWAQTQIETL